MFDGVSGGERGVKGQSAASAQIDNQRKWLVATVVERNVDHVWRARRTWGAHATESGSRLLTAVVRGRQFAGLGRGLRRRLVEATGDAANFGVLALQERLENVLIRSNSSLVVSGKREGLG